ncbi:MAG: aminotransferase class V-fold PLP-dependent enzyme, partial [Planctomycetales bacterium]
MGRLIGTPDLIDLACRKIGLISWAARTRRDQPWWETRMSDPERIYLDNAATSWPKPESVYETVDRYQRECGAPAGRGAYSEAVEIDRRVSDARRSTAKLLGAESPQRIIFT